MQLQVLLVPLVGVALDPGRRERSCFGFCCRMCRPAFGFRRVLTCVVCYTLAQGLPRVDNSQFNSVHVRAPTHDDLQLLCQDPTRIEFAHLLLPRELSLAFNHSETSRSATLLRPESDRDPALLTFFQPFAGRLKCLALLDQILIP